MSFLHRYTRKIHISVNLFTYGIESHLGVEINFLFSLKCEVDMSAFLLIYQIHLSCTNIQIKFWSYTYNEDKSNIFKFYLWELQCPQCCECNL